MGEEEVGERVEQVGLWNNQSTYPFKKGA